MEFLYIYLLVVFFLFAVISPIVKLYVLPFRTLALISYIVISILGFIALTWWGVILIWLLSMFMSQIEFVENYVYELRKKYSYGYVVVFQILMVVITIIAFIHYFLMVKNN